MIRWIQFSVNLEFKKDSQCGDRCTRVLLVLPPGVNLIAAINYLVSLAGRINFTDSYTPSKADRILCMQIEKVYLMVNSQKSKYAHNLLETMFGRNQFGDRMLWISDGGQVN